MNLLNNISFNNPELFFLLILPFAHALWYFFSKNNTESVLSFSNTAFFSSKKSIKERIIHLPYLLKILSICLIITSLARPQTTNSWEESITKGVDIIIAMDISGSMLASDLKPNRLDASKNIAIKFISKRKNDRIGLVVFSGKSLTQCPLTTDHNTLKNLIDSIEYGMVEDGTAIGYGLETSINRLSHSNAESKIIILLTDGVNSVDEISLVSAANDAASDSIKIYTIGVGTDGIIKVPVRDMLGRIFYENRRVEIDEKTLKKISSKTGGKYFRATDNESLKEIYNIIDELETYEIKTVNFINKTEEFYVFSLIALVIYLLSFILKITYFKGIN
jgi:Ca-activated chloride channel family protein